MSGSEGVGLVEIPANARALDGPVHAHETANPFDAHIDAVVDSVFLSMLEIAVRVSAAAHEPPTDALSASVQFHDGWRGELALELGSDAADRVTRLLLGSDAAGPTAEEIQDAVGEIANIIAGNIKVHLPAGAGMGLPSVMPLQLVSRPGQIRLASRSYECDAGSFSVVLVEGV